VYDRKIFLIVLIVFILSRDALRATEKKVSLLLDRGSQSYLSWFIVSLVVSIIIATFTLLCAIIMQELKKSADGEYRKFTVNWGIVTLLKDLMLWNVMLTCWLCFFLVIYILTPLSKFTFFHICAVLTIENILNAFYSLHCLAPVD